MTAQLITHEDGTAEVLCDRCTFCGEQERIPLDHRDIDGVRAWLTGQLIQSVLWHWPADKRELLITGTHPKCWEENMRFPEEDDEGEAFEVVSKEEF